MNVGLFSLAFAFFSSGFGRGLSFFVLNLAGFQQEGVPSRQNGEPFSFSCIRSNSPTLLFSIFGLNEPGPKGCLHNAYMPAHSSPPEKSFVFCRSICGNVSFFYRAFLTLTIARFVSWCPQEHVIVLKKKPPPGPILFPQRYALYSAIFLREGRVAEFPRWSFSFC